MLSSTNTITDVKNKLENDYTFFGFSSDALFVNSITSVAEDVLRIRFIPTIGQREYDVIKAKNKVALTEYQTNLYWAEVFSICFDFLREREAKTSQLQSNSNESLSVEGYSYKIGSGSGSSSPGDKSSKFYFGKMYTYWKLAGFDLNALQRTCTIFGDSGTGLFGRTILE